MDILEVERLVSMNAIHMVLNKTCSDTVLTNNVFYDNKDYCWRNMIVFSEGRVYIYTPDLRNFVVVNPDKLVNNISTYINGEWKVKDESFLFYKNPVEKLIKSYSKVDSLKSLPQEVKAYLRNSKIEKLNI